MFSWLEKAGCSSSVPKKRKASPSWGEGDAGDKFQHVTDQTTTWKSTSIPPHRGKNDQC